MMCMSCKAQWSLQDGQAKFTNCPFCGTEMSEEKEEKEYKDIVEALQAIAEMKGKDYLINRPLEVQGIFRDITKNLKREVRLLKLFYENETQKFFADAGEVSEARLNMAVRRLQEDTFIEPQFAKYIVDCFAYVLGIKECAPKLGESKLSGQPETSAELTLQLESEEGALTKAWDREQEKSTPLRFEKLEFTGEYSLEKEKNRDDTTEIMIAAGDLRNGITIDMLGEIYQVIEVHHVKPGRGAAFVRTNLKNLRSGGVVQKTFRPAENCLQARIERKDMQYLYSDGELYHFMDPETYEQIALKSEILGDALKFVRENDMVRICSHNGSIFSAEPPLFAELEVTETAPGFKGDTSLRAVKPATVETGVTIKVPLFINKGDTIKIDSRTGEYLCRV